MFQRTPFLLRLGLLIATSAHCSFAQVKCNPLFTQIKAEEDLVSELAQSQALLDVTVPANQVRMGNTSHVIAQINNVISQIYSQLVALGCEGPQPSPSSVTKPSDVFFDNAPPSALGWGPDNAKSSYAIVAKGVTLRGWLVRAFVNLPDGTNTKDSAPSPVSPMVVINEKAGSNHLPGSGLKHLGYEDVHYRFVIDPQFIPLVYGFNNGALNGAQLPGNPPPADNPQTKPVTAQDTWLDGTPIGVDINSFWIPNLPTPGTWPINIHTELNAWHQRNSNLCNGFESWFWPFGCWWRENYTGRGPAPVGWCEKEYTAGPPNGNTHWCDPAFTTGPPGTASDNWWPFDPDDPDGVGFPLTDQEWNYVEMTGTLWQDTAHDSGGPSSCWGDAFPGQDGWTEIHPIDSLRRLWITASSPFEIPDKSELNSAIEGNTKAVSVSLCTEAGDSSVQNSPNLICPEALISRGQSRSGLPTPLIPHVQEIIDGRFTDPSLFGLSRTVTVGPKDNADCVGIEVSLLGGNREHFKATYLVRWTTDLLPDAGTISSASPNVGPAAGGTLVSINGSAFGNTPAKVLFGTAAVTPLSGAGANQVQATTPAGMPGTVTIQVMHDGVASPPAPTGFTYCGPAVSRISPSSGPLNGGTAVTITGSCFTGAASVQFGAQKLDVGTGQATINSDTEITAIAPPANCGVVVSVTVTSPALGGVTTSPLVPHDQFSYTDSACGSCLQICQSQLDACLNGAAHHGVSGCYTAWNDCRNSCATSKQRVTAPSKR